MCVCLCACTGVCLGLSFSSQREFSDKVGICSFSWNIIHRWTEKDEPATCINIFAGLLSPSRHGIIWRIMSFNLENYIWLHKNLHKIHYMIWYIYACLCSFSRGCLKNFQNCRSCVKMALEELRLLLPIVTSQAHLPSVMDCHRAVLFVHNCSYFT